MAAVGVLNDPSKAIVLVIKATRQLMPPTTTQFFFFFKTRVSYSLPARTIGTFFTTNLGTLNCSLQTMS